MRSHPSSHFLPFTAALLALAITTGCAHPHTATEIAKAHGLANVNSLSFTPADKTTVVGKAAWISPTDSIAVIELNRKSFPVDTFLVGRDQNLKPTSVLLTTHNVRGKFQGVMLVAGVPGKDDEIVQPGPELAPMVQQNIDTYLAAQQPKTQPADTTTTTSSAPAPAPTETPVATPAPSTATDASSPSIPPAPTTDTPAPTTTTTTQ